jgi:hypothetical protein
MVNMDEAFEEWLNEPMEGSGYNSKSRRHFVEKHNLNLGDLYWAFCNGWFRGQQQVVKGLQNV